MSRLAAVLGLVLCGLATAAEAEWRKVIQPGDRPSIDRALEFVNAVHNALDSETRKNDAKAVGEVSTLVTRTSLPFTDTELAGKWRCRSIQGGSLGIFAYPFFNCSIESRGGRLFLSKTSGSQFRKGAFYPDGKNQRRIFLGVQYVTGDRPAGYSGTFPKAELDGESLQFDSVGVLVKKGAGHFVLILDAAAESYEIYEFRR